LCVPVLADNDDVADVGAGSLVAAHLHQDVGYEVPLMVQLPCAPTHMCAVHFVFFKIARMIMIMTHQNLYPTCGLIKPTQPT